MGSATELTKEVKGVEGEEVYGRRWWILAVLWRGGAVIPAASASGEEPG